MNRSTLTVLFLGIAGCGTPPVINDDAGTGGGASEDAGTSNGGGSVSAGGGTATGGGTSSVGGGTSTGGGSSSIGGGTATGGGSSSIGGGTATGGGTSTGGGSSVTDAGVDPLRDAGVLQTITDGGFGFLEGPVWLAQQQQLQFSDVTGSLIWRYTPQTGAFSVFRTNAGNPNGEALDSQGRLVVCEMGARQVTRTEFDGGITVIASAFDGGRLNSPNDLTTSTDGTIYFTDPVYNTPTNQLQLGFEGVYRLSPGGTLSLLVSNLGKPNGIGLSPDESTLYVNDIQRSQVRRYPINGNGTLGTPATFNTTDLGGTGGDGVAIDDDGNYYVATSLAGSGGAVKVYTADGVFRGRIVTPVAPTNMAFGDADRRTLYITASGTLFRIRLNVPGKPF